MFLITDISYGTGMVSDYYYFLTTFTSVFYQMPIQAFVCVFLS